MRLRDSQTNELLPGKNVRNDLRLDCVGTEVQHRRETDNLATEDAIAVSTRAAARYLLRDDELVEVVELCREISDEKVRIC